MLNEIISIIASLLAAGACFLVCRLYWHEYVALYLGDREATTWFGHGIVVGFAAGGINAIWWGVFWYCAILFDEPEIVQAMNDAGGYVNLFLKGGLVWASYCHLYARWIRLSEDDKRQWSVLTVPWHPRHPLGPIRALLRCKDRRP